MNDLRVRTSELAWRLVGTDVVLLDERTSKYLQLEGSGAFLWQRLVDGTTAEHLAEALSEQFGLDPQTARRDVDTFIAELTRRDLVVHSPS